GDIHIAVPGRGQSAGGAVPGIEAVDVIHILSVPDVAEQGVIFQNLQAVPAHVGDLQRLVRQVPAEVHYLAGHQPQAGVLPVLKALVKQQLHPQADAQERLLLRLLLNHRHQAGGIQLGAGVPKGAHAGQDDPVCRPEAAGVAGDLRLQVQGPQAGEQREQVPHAVVYNCNHLQHTLRAG
ncbi:DNA-directed RNA polymerase specialized sigma subunit, sigma24 family, partial [Dysosmobacter welbionis]